MTDQCLDPGEIGEIAGLPADDPRRRHLDTCPHCRGLARALDIFLEPGNTSDLGDVAGADAELQARLATAIPGRSTGTNPSTSRRWPMLAMAAVLALCALGLTATEILRQRDSALPQLDRRQRGDSRDTRLIVVRTTNGLHIAWPGIPAADEVVYVFLSDDMDELGRHVAPGVLQLAVGDQLSAATYCQAFAVLQGDTVGRSGITGLMTNRE